MLTLKQPSRPTKKCWNLLPSTPAPAAIEFSRVGDTFVVTKLDWLTRSITDLLQTLHL